MWQVEFEEFLEDLAREKQDQTLAKIYQKTQDLNDVLQTANKMFDAWLKRRMNDLAEEFRTEPDVRWEIMVLLEDLLDIDIIEHEEDEE